MRGLTRNIDPAPKSGKECGRRRQQERQNILDKGTYMVVSAASVICCLQRYHEITSADDDNEYTPLSVAIV